MTKDIVEFGKILEDYVSLKEWSAIESYKEGILDLGMDMIDLKEYYDDLMGVANKHNIQCFRIADDSDYNEYVEYIEYLENKLITALKNKLISKYYYDK